MSHGIVRCRRCNTVISQCRCMSHKDVTYSICDTCELETIQEKIEPSSPYMQHQRISNLESENKRLLEYVKYMFPRLEESYDASPMYKGYHDKMKEIGEYINPEKTNAPN